MKEELYPPKVRRLLLWSFKKSLIVVISFFGVASLKATPLINEKSIEEDYLKKQWQIFVQTPEDIKRLHFFQGLYKKQCFQKPLQEIPKVLHVIWLGPNSLPPHAFSSVSSWMEFHPNWKIKCWTDHQRASPIPGLQLCNIEQFPLKELADLYYNSQSFEERSIILRYAILLNEGGSFFDYNLECLASIESLRSSSDFFCGLEVPGSSSRSSTVNPACHLIASTANHPILNSVKQWLVKHWAEYEELFSGTDVISLANRMLHRTVHALSYGIETAHCVNERNDKVFPPHFFSTDNRQIATYAVFNPKALLGRRIQQEENEEKMQEAFETIRKKQRFTLSLIVVLSITNAILILLFIKAYKKRKKQ